MKKIICILAVLILILVVYIHVLTTPKASVEIDMIVENHFNGDEAPNDPIIQFNLENLSEMENISEIEREDFNRVISSENFSEGEMTFNFGVFEFEEQGIFKYRVSQVIHEDLLEQENWNLDLVSFYITFNVAQSEQGELEVEYTIQKSEDDETLLVDNIRFINSYSPSE